jgi:hypothetical protein
VGYRRAFRDGGTPAFFLAAKYVTGCLALGTLSIVMNSKPANACFITGADNFYFAMAGMLGTSCARYFPDIPFRILDFGLTPEQARFCAGKNWLIERPPSLANIDHPYALKSQIARYLGNMPDTTVVWLDCDMIAGRDGRIPLDDIIHRMKTSGQSVAACRDQGAASIADFLTSYPSPTLAERISANERTAPYLNIGTTIFTDREFLGSWAELSSPHEASRDFCFEQNAFNVWARRNPEKFIELDARCWNVHGPLLAQTTMTTEGPVCEGESAIILHATSANNTQSALEQITLVARGHSLPAVIKWFRNIDLRKLQAGWLSLFLRDNLPALLVSGVLTESKPDPQYTVLSLS